MLDASILRWLGVALVAIGGTAWMLLLDSDSWLVRRWDAYGRRLDEMTSFLRLGIPGARLARGQALVCGALVALAAIVDMPLLLALVPVIAIAPLIVLKARHQRRVEAIEAQIDGWLVILANALRGAPSLGEALRSSAPLIEAPLSEELDVVLKEMRLGTAVDVAVVNLGSRVGSRPVQGALAAILVGRQTGGDLSEILEETAASLREMTRLEGVLRAKTAEGRSQAYVLGAIPFFLIIAIQTIDPNWMTPLTETGIGMVVTAVALTLWLTAILLARRILAVDL